MRSMEITTRPSMVMVGRQWNSCQQRLRPQFFLSLNPRPIVQRRLVHSFFFVSLRNRCSHRSETATRAEQVGFEIETSATTERADDDGEKSHQKVKGSVPRRHFSAISHKGAIQRRGDNEQNAPCLCGNYISSSSRQTTSKMLKWLSTGDFRREKSSFHLHNYIVFG